MPSRRVSCSHRGSADGATGGIRSSTASTRRCRGRSRSTGRRRTTSTTRRSSTSSSGTFSASCSCSGSTGASGSAGPRSSRSTSWCTRPSVRSRRRYASTRRTTSSGCGSTSGYRLRASLLRPRSSCGGSSSGRRASRAVRRARDRVRRRRGRRWRCRAGADAPADGRMPSSVRVARLLTGSACGQCDRYAAHHLWFPIVLAVGMGGSLLAGVVLTIRNVRAEREPDLSRALLGSWITIHRRRIGPLERWSVWKIRIDGEVVARIGSGETRRVGVAPGSHVVALGGAARFAAMRSASTSRAAAKRNSSASSTAVWLSGTSGPSATSRRSRSGASEPSVRVATLRPMIVRELELDLDAFEGPFDLLLTLVLKDELDLRDVDVAGIVVAFVERLAEREQLDLDACGEFLVLIAALLELKARGLFPEEAAELAELEPEEAAEELARRLAEYRRMKDAAGWLRERLATEGERYFRLGPAPLAPKVETPLAPQDPARLAEVLRLLAKEPAQVSLAHMALRFPPVTPFLERFRAVLRRRARLDFEQEMSGLSRVEQAVAFLAMLELRRTGEVRIEQAQPFAPIRISRTDVESEDSWTLRSA